MTEKDFISKKSKDLISKGYNKSQAYMMAKMQFLKQGSSQKAQQGVSFEESLQGNPMTGYYNQTNTAITKPQIPYEEGLPNTSQIANNQPYSYNPGYKFTGTDLNLSDKERGNLVNKYDQDSSQGDTQQINKVNIYNPYAGVDMGAALNYAGRGFGERDPYKAGIGTSLALLKGSRDFLSGVGTGRQDRNTYNDYIKNLYKDQAISQPLGQQGGAIKNSDILASNAITNDPQGNVNLEGNEFVKRNNGLVQPVVGEPHIKNGKLAEGVDAKLESGDKVLSDYTKITPRDIKDMKSRYDISLKKGDTYAKGLSKVEAKIGLKKETDKLADLAEKLEKTLGIKDKTTKELSIQTLKTLVATQNEKINSLKEVSSVVFEDLFNRQELIPKKGDGSQLFDKKGEEVTETTNEVAQEGGEQQDQVTQLIQAYAQASGQDPQVIMQQLQQMQPEQQQQALKQMVQELQGGQEQGEVNQNSQEEGQEMGIAQQGGVIELATKYGISPARAQELLSLQEGGMQNQEEETQEGKTSNAQEEQGEVSPEQIVQAFAQLTQQDPEAIVQQLQSMSPEEQQQAIMQMSQALQQGQQNPQEEQAEGQMSNPQEEQMEMAQEGGKIYAQEALPNGYSFSTRISPTLSGYDTQGTSILNQDTLSNVEANQTYTGKGYGQKMADVEDTIKIHNWYFNTEDKKKAFREAVTKKGAQPEVKAFQEAYNKEIESRAKKAGIPETDIGSIKQQVGFSNSGVQNVDGLFGAFTSTRPLYDFSKKDGKVEIKPTPETAILAKKEQELGVNVNTKTVYPMLPVDLRLPPSGLVPLLKSEVNLGRMRPIKQTVEPYLAEQARQQQTAREQLNATGLPPQQQEALLAQQLASGQLASNDAISKVENFNAQNQYATDQFNVGQGAKEQLANQQFAQDYQDKMLSGIANTQRDWRNYLTESNLQNRANYNSIENANLLNATSENFQYLPGQGVQYLDNKAGNLAQQNITNEQARSMSPAQWEKYKQDKINADKKNAYLS